MRTTSHRLALLCLLSTLATAACTDDAPTSADEDWGMEGPLEPTPPPGKEDSEFRKGPLVNTNTTRTQVWTARNKWEDRETPASRVAGVAWSADSGLSWDEKYATWLASLAWIPSLDGYSMTVEVTTPWGTTLPSPYLECAEMAMFLRITFAAWYELPFFMEAVSNGQRVYFGHFGVRSGGARFSGTPEFGVAYKDYTAQHPTTFPHDQALRTRKLYGGVDEQPEISSTAVFGAYVDELHLNKRAAYFTVLALNYLSSINVADSANTYNLVPDAVRAGDVLVERWQASGIGHTLIVHDVQAVTGGGLDVTTISGSMPRRQGVRDSGVASKSYFTSEYAGGLGYERLGGGLKRWRVAKNVGGYWTNTWMSGDEAHWINSTDYARIADRPGRFAALLGQLTVAQQREGLLGVIADARHHLEQYPASCAARERREHAFSQLYALDGRAAVDADHRDLADDVLSELAYTQSKTCCWNSSTSAMYDIVMDYANAEQAAADAAGTCVAPTVFRSEQGGYARWAAYAAQTGRASQWRAWSEDESCAQRAVAQDTVAASDATPFCDR